MKRIVTLTIILMALAACTVLPPTQAPPEPAATEMPQAGLPNPASVHCRQGGNELEIRTAADGSQYGVCIFPDGSTCDEWAYFRGECGPGAGAAGGYKPPETAEALADWWGVIKSTQPGAQFDDYFERQDLGQVILFGIDSLDPAVSAQIHALRDSGKIVHLWGTLLSNVPDVNGSQVRVDRIEVEEQASGGYKPPETAEALADWWGVIKSTQPGAQFDDYFERQDLGQVILFGIDSLDPAVSAQIHALRDSGKIVHLWGTLLSNVPDVNGSQVRVDRIEVEE